MDEQNASCRSHIEAMPLRRIAPLVIASLMLLGGTARAQWAPTCSFDSATATLNVTVNGIAATLVATDTGAIQLNGADCAGATTTTIDVIAVQGFWRADNVTLSGSFAPGLTSEPDTSEIEIVLSLGSGADTVSVSFTNAADLITFAATGLDIGNDLDEDITIKDVERLNIRTLDGDDTIDASAYVGGVLGLGREIVLYGGRGNDVIIGSDCEGQVDRLYGQGGNDTLYGGEGRDELAAGPENDTVCGEGGNDIFIADAVVDGDDDYYGGSGRDLIDCSSRTVGVTILLGNGLPDDGQPGVEHDRMVSIENETGGSGDDVLIGSGAQNILTGGPGK
jgi:Ca2+-binding RTX toxin-like protein